MRTAGVVINRRQADCVEVLFSGFEVARACLSYGVDYDSGIRRNLVRHEAGG